MSTSTPINTSNQTEYKVADAEQLLDEMKKLSKSNITISAFCSTHSRPLIYVHQSDELTKYVIDKTVVKRRVTKTEIESYFMEGGVRIAWVDTIAVIPQRVH